MGGRAAAAVVSLVLVATLARAQARTESFVASGDATLYSQSPTLSAGAASLLEVDGSPDAVTLVQWDLRAIPAGAQVHSATLTLFVSDPSARSFDFFEVLRSWSEGQATWKESAAGVRWSKPGAQGKSDRGTSKLGTINAPFVGSHALTLQGAALAALQRWVDDPSRNFGFILQHLRNADELRFASREATDPAQRLLLTVTWTLATTDAGTPDAGTLDAGTEDAGTPDAGSTCTPEYGSFGPGSWPPGCWRPYADSSPFNRPLPEDPPLHPKSNEIMARIHGDISLYDYPQNLIANESGNSGEPTYYPRATDPVFTLHCNAPWGVCPLEGLQVRIPAGAQVENGVAADTSLPMEGRNDAHLTLVDQQTGWEYDLWQVQTTPIPAAGGTLNLSWGGLTRIDGDGTASESGGTGSNVGSLAGRLRAEELLTGELRHAIAIVVDCTSTDFVYPAKKTGRLCSELGLSNVNAPPMGAHLQLAMTPEEIDALAIPPWKKLLLRAMARYGMFVTETGSRHLFAIEQEAGNQYQSLGYPDRWLEFAQASGWFFYSPDRNYVGSMRLDADGIDWRPIWSRLRVIHPCVASDSCGPSDLRTAHDHPGEPAPPAKRKK